MKKTTKRFPVAVAFESYVPKRTEFVVPFMEGTHGDEFMGLKSGSACPFGAVSYMGIDVSVSDIFQKNIGPNIATLTSDAVAAILAKYINALDEFRIGNVIRIEYQPGGEFTLHKVADRPRRTKRPKLP